MKIEQRTGKNGMIVQDGDEMIAMTIDPAAMQHVMGVLTNLYSNQILAVIREYSTNAWDAHVEAANMDAIQVTIDSDFFKVRDFGIGMDRDDIANTYSQYGTSTKRNSNDVVGMLGLGCKSALTYADMFIVRGIKNGVCTHVEVGRNGDGAPYMNIVNTYPVNEPDGVEVAVPIASGYDLTKFKDEANKFFRFWEEGTVELNETIPTRIDGMWLNDKTLLTKEVDQNYVVMGNVPYPTGQHSYGRHAEVYFVNIGDVEIAPSREALQTTAKTNSKLVELKNNMVRMRDAALDKLVDAAPNRREAIAVAVEARQIGAQKDFTYRGHLIPKAFFVEGEESKFVVATATKKHRRAGYYSYESLPSESASKSYWVLNHSGTFTGYKYNKLEAWANANGITGTETQIIVVNENTDMTEELTWCDPTKVFDWAAVKAFKMPRVLKEKRNDGRPTGSYEGYVNNVYEPAIAAESIDTSLPIFYINKDDSNYVKQVLAFLHPEGFTQVVLGGNRVKKFLREFPTAKYALAYAREAAQKWVETLSEDDLLAWYFDDMHGSSVIDKLDPEKIDDPALRKHITYSNASLEETPLRNWVTRPTVKYDFEPTKKYPLLEALYRTHGKTAEEHTYLYLNLIHGRSI